MVRTKQIINNRWVYGDAVEVLQPGDKIEFTCNGRGRGGHCNVFAVVAKTNKKTVKAVETLGSYSPGVLWTVSLNETIYKVL
jgi:hypothetical protein